MKRLSHRKKPDIVKAVMMFFYIILIALFLLPFLMMTADNMPKRRIDGKLTERCEELFMIKFDGSFTPAEYRKRGFQDCVYLLTLKDIQSPGVIMAQYRRDGFTVEPLGKDSGKYTADPLGSGKKPAEVYTVTPPPPSQVLYIYFYIEEDNTCTAVLTYN